MHEEMEKKNFGGTFSQTKIKVNISHTIRVNKKLGGRSQIFLCIIMKIFLSFTFNKINFSLKEFRISLLG